MKIRNTTMLAAMLLSFVGASAQKMKLEKGSFKDLSGENTVNVEFTYEDMKVGTGKNEMKESEYVENKVKEYNEDEPGRGEEWQQAWVADRDARFERKFLELFNEGAEGYGMKLEEGAEGAKYTIKINTEMTEPGFSIPMVMTKNAAVTLKATLLDNASGDVLAVVLMEESPGRAFSGAAWDTGIRIQEGYAKAGKTFAKWLPKKGMK